MVEKFELLEVLRKIYNNKNNTEEFSMGMITSSMKVISIDIINKNLYLGPNDEITEFDKIYVKNQKTGEDVFFNIRNLKSYKLSNESISFTTDENTYIIPFGFELA